MAATNGCGRIELLLKIVEQAYRTKAWHGPNLRGTIRRVTAADAVWKPQPQRHSIGEIVIHAAYWKYSVHRRLRGGERGSFPWKGSNWFRLPEPCTESDWKEIAKLLDGQHAELVAAVAAFPEARLSEVPPGSKFPYDALIYGVASHDLYHAGQIQYLKRLRANVTEAGGHGTTHSGGSSRVDRLRGRVCQQPVFQQNVLDEGGSQQGGPG